MRNSLIYPPVIPASTQDILVLCPATLHPRSLRSLLGAQHAALSGLLSVCSSLLVSSVEQPIYFSRARPRRKLAVPFATHSWDKIIKVRMTSNEEHTDNNPE